MEVISLDGQVLYKKELSKTDNNLAYDTALLKPGMYLVQFTGEDRKQPLVYRIIKIWPIGYYFRPKGIAWKIFIGKVFILAVGFNAMPSIEWKTRFTTPY